MGSLFDMHGEQQNETFSDDDGTLLVENRPCSRQCLFIYNKVKKHKAAIYVLVSILIIVATTGVSLGLGSFAYFVVKPTTKIDVSLSAFAIPNHPAWQRWNALKLAFRGRRDRRSAETGSRSSNLYAAGELSGATRARRSYGVCDGHQSQRWKKLSIVYMAQGDGGNIFTKNRIEFIHRIENQIQSWPDFQDVCLIDFRTCNCVPMNSILTYFYPSQRSDGTPTYDGKGSDMLDIDVALNYALSSSSMTYLFTDGRVNANFHESRFLRSEILFGGPLKGYQNIYDRGDEQTEKYLKFTISLRDTLLSNTSNRDVRVLYHSNELFNYEVNEVFWNDLQLSTFSCVFIVIFMFVLTSFSIWLTFWGIATILLSFPLAFFFYRVVFGIVNMRLLNGIAAFLIIGIGVDDVFVFINTFRQLSHIDDLWKRIYRTTLTAGKATLFTSFTTAAAFAANIFSSIPAVHQFGLFMTLIVTCCWFLVVLILPPVIVLWHQWFGCCETACYTWNRFFRCQVRKALRLPDDVAQFLENQSVDCHQTLETVRQDSEDVALLHYEEQEFTTGVLAANLDDDDDDDDPLLRLEEEILQTQTRNEEAKKREGCNLNSWLQGILYYYVALPVIKARIAIVVVFVALLVVSIGCFTQISYATKPPQLFRPDTNLEMIIDLMANYSNPYTLCDDCSGYFIDPAPKVPTSSSPLRTTARPSYSPGGQTQRYDPSTRSPSTPPVWAPTGSRLLSTTAAVRGSSVVSSLATTDSHATSLPTRKTDVASVTPHVYRNLTLNPCEGDQCKDIQDHPPLESGILVYVVFGIKGINQTGESVLPDEGTTIYDDEFYAKYQFSSLDISDLCRLCKKIISATDLVLPNTSQCWPTSALFSSGFNVDSEECKDVPRSYMDEKGVWRDSQLNIGYDRNGIRWLSFSFRSTTYKGQSSFNAYEKYQKWDSLIKSLVKELPPDSPLRSMYQTSEFWKQVMMEIVAVSSAIYGLVLSMLICILAVAVFTGHVVLLLITVVTMIGLVSLVLAIFFWAGWELGAIEAMSLSILVGSSVDYCVHIVEGYLLAGKNHPPLESGSSVRRWRASVAVSHIGTSVVSSALTTIVAAIPLTKTILVPFSRFGQIVAINTSVSIVYALTACVAFLSLFAPAKFTNSTRSVAKMVAAMVLFVGLLFLVLFIISRCGIDIPAPNGEDLFPK